MTKVRLSTNSPHQFAIFALNACIPISLVLFLLCFSSSSMLDVASSANKKATLSGGIDIAKRLPVRDLSVLAQIGIVTEIDYLTTFLNNNYSFNNFMIILINLRSRCCWHCQSHHCHPTYHMLTLLLTPIVLVGPSTIFALYSPSACSFSIHPK